MKKEHRKTELTKQQKEIVKNLNSNLYTVDYLEEWINRNDNVFVNTLGALNAMGAKGYYEAVKDFISFNYDRLSSIIPELEELLDTTYQVAIQTDELLGNEEDEFLESNPDWKFHDGILTAIKLFGLGWDRHEDQYRVLSEGFYG